MHGNYENGAGAQGRNIVLCAGAGYISRVRFWVGKRGPRPGETEKTALPMFGIVYFI